MKKKVEDYQIVWNECLKVIRENVPLQSFETWFEPIKPIGLQKEVLTIQVPTMFFHEFLERTYWELLKTAIKKALGTDGKLEYNIPIVNSPKEAEKSTITLPTSSVNGVSLQDKSCHILSSEDKDGRKIPNPFVLPGIEKLKINSQLNKNLNFDNFIEGECNRLARAAGYAIACKPGSTFNPLFIYSNVGLGKTHLSHAIGLETKVNHPDLTVLYVDTETFVQQYVEAARSRNINDFVHFYQMLDVLIIDDIQFLAAKPSTQDIFFHIFNFYHQKGKQLIISADKSPAEIAGFEERMLSRFKWGLSAELLVPDKETRIKIIQKKLYNNGIENIPDEVVEYLAYRIVSNVREIEGALISILAQSSLNKKQITVELAKQMIDKFVKSTAHEISIDYIQKVVCDYYNIPVDQLFSKSRERSIVQVRHTSMYFARKFTELSLAQIGAKCGKKDHATVLHACRSIENLLITDKKVKEDIHQIDKILKNS